MSRFEARQDPVIHHEQMRRYLQHRERVLEAKSVIKTNVQRSRSAPSRPSSSSFRPPRQQQIDNENRRLMSSLIKISRAPSTYKAK